MARWHTYIVSGLIVAIATAHAHTQEDLAACIKLHTLRQYRNAYATYENAGRELRTHLGDNGTVRKNIDSIPGDGAIIAAIVQDMQEAYQIDDIDAMYAHKNCDAVRRAFAQHPDDMYRIIAQQTDAPDALSELADSIDKDQVDGWQAVLLRADMNREIFNAYETVKQNIHNHLEQ